MKTRQDLKISNLTAQKDKAYKERNELVSFLTTCYQSYLCRHPEDDTDWDDDWRWIVCVKSPIGQMTWHIHDSDLHMFEHLSSRDKHTWDGHTTEIKYGRLRKLINEKVNNEHLYCK